MQPQTVHVRAPSRLHFGLFSFGNVGRQFGGVGVMIQRPALEMTITESCEIHVQGELATEVLDYLKRRARDHRSRDLPACRIEIHSAPRRHAGLGSGTQLALSLEAGFNALARGYEFGPEDFARATGRARRSAVGTYGFVFGGLIVEAGRLPEEAIAPLEKRVPIPQNWRFALIDTGDRQGLSGAAEQKAFASLPPVSRDVRDRLTREVFEEMIPSIEAQNCAAFGESVYRYGRTAGSCFAPIQGGPYNGERLNTLVQDIRDLGIHGVGQSSWGPILFCILPDQVSAERLRDALVARYDDQELRVTITAADNGGALVTRGCPAAGESASRGQFSN